VSQAVQIIDYKDEPSALVAPTVVLPIDPNAVRRIYQASQAEDADALANSFMDKTFDLTFRVPVPVLSDWQHFLKQQMHSVFGQYLEEDWPMVVGLLYDECANRRSENARGQYGRALVTPRSINTLVNELGVLWLQWRKENIKFASLAYYAINRERIDTDIFTALTTPAPTIRSLDDEWQSSVASLHHGVSPPLGLQVVIEHPLNAALFNGETNEFKRLKEIPGFELILQRTIENTSHIDGINPNFVYNAATLIDGFAFSDPARSRSVWRALQSMLRADDGTKLSKSHATGLAAVSRHTEAPARLVDIAIRILEHSDAESLKNETPRESFVDIASVIAECERRAGLSNTKIEIPGPAVTYIDVLLSRPSLAGKFTPRTEGPSVVAQLVADLRDASRARIVESVLPLLITQADVFPWAPLLERSAEIVQGETGSSPGMPGALFALGLLRDDSGAAEKLKALAKAGHFQSRIGEAYSQNLLPVLGRAVTLLMISGSKLPLANGVAWERAIVDRPGLVDSVTEALVEFGVDDVFELLVRSSSTNPDAMPLIRGIGDWCISTGHVGALNLESGIDNVSASLDCLSEEKRSSFVKELSRREQFWPILRAAPLSSDTTILLQYLLEDPDEETRATAAKLVREKLQDVPKETWLSAVISGEEPVPLMQSMREAGYAVQLGSDLSTALHDLISQVVTNDSTSNRVSWFRSTEWLSASARQALFRNLRDSLFGAITQVPDPVGLIESGGASFLSVLDEEPDASVRHLVVILLRTQAGLNWLQGNIERAAQWVKNAKLETREFAQEQLSGMARSADDEEKGSMERLSEAWGLGSASAKRIPNR
jgi:hypothetical protein